MKIKSFKYRIYPNDSQKEKLDKSFGCYRFIYNYFLNIRKESYLKGVKLNYYNNAKELTELKTKKEFVWLNEVNSQILQQSLRN